MYVNVVIIENIVVFAFYVLVIYGNRMWLIAEVKDSH